MVFIESFNFSFFTITGWYIDLKFCDIEWFTLETNRDQSVVFEIASNYCISDSFVGYDGYSISSNEFLPTVVDIMVTWMEVHDIVQETGIMTIPKKKKCKKAKWLSEEALQIAEKKREVKGKGEKERYVHLNTKFQRI